jgi:hypothetical protein
MRRSLASLLRTAMIRNKTEYHEASKRLGDELKRLDEHRARLKEAGLGDVEVKRVIDPLESLHLQLKEEVEAYERLKRGEFEELDCGHREQTFPRKLIFVAILDICCRILIYIEKVGRPTTELRV